MDSVLSETKVAERFTEHDLRAKCASDADWLEHARALLSHANARTTEVIYRRKPERVRSLKSISIVQTKKNRLVFAQISG